MSGAIAGDERRSLPVGVVIVTFNSGTFLRRALEAIQNGTAVPSRIVIIDNASQNTAYLEEARRMSSSITVIRLAKNLGFCGGNNRGIAALGDDSLDVLLLNPDAFVSENFLEDAWNLMKAQPAIGALGPKLLGAHPVTGAPTGLIDSAGIVQRRWGQFLDRGMGERDLGQYNDASDVTALCGAAMLIRRRALIDIAPNGELFDERFFMYKEDLDVCFRLRRAGWRTAYDPSLTVLHCRGWDADRQSMPIWTRRRSLINEWRLWRRGWSPERSRWMALPYLVVKSLVVGIGR